MVYRRVSPYIEYFLMSEYVFFKFREVNKYLIDGLVKGTIYFA